MLVTRRKMPLCAAVLVLAACQDSSSGTGASAPATSGTPASATKGAEGLPDRDPQLAKRLVAQGALLLDVRTKEEFDERHLEGAELIPVQELEARMNEVDKLTGGDKSKPIVVYCRSGARAGRAKSMLSKAGHTQVTNLGGIDAWPGD